MPPLPVQELPGRAGLGRQGHDGSQSDILVGDGIVFVRKGGGHVLVAIGLSADNKRVIGIDGNQSDAVSIAELEATRLYAVRRPLYED